MSEWNYIVGAYVLTWVGIIGYAVHVARRLRQAAADLDGANVTETEMGR